MSPNLLIAAGAQAAAQGLVRSALLTKLLPFAGAASLLVGLFGRKGRTETRPVAATSTAGAPAARRQPRSSRSRPRSGRTALRPRSETPVSRTPLELTSNTPRRQLEQAPGNPPRDPGVVNLNHGGHSHG